MSLENTKTQGFVTIRYIVMSILNRLKEYSMRDYKYIAQLVIEGFTDLNMYHLSNNVEVQYLYMTAAKTVSVPTDFIDWIKVGITINGKIMALTKDDSIALPRKFEDGKDVGNIDASNINQYVVFTDHFRRGRYVGGMYGMRGGVNQAYYRYDAERRQFIFTGNIPRSEIVLEYISSGVSLTSSTVIPRVAHQPLVYYFMWQRVEFDPRVSESVKARKQALYDQEVEKARYFTSAPTIEEYRDSLYKSIKQTAKR